MINTRTSLKRLPPPHIVLLPAVVTGLLWASSANQISLIQAAAAFLLLVIPFWSYWNWQQTGYRGLPLFTGTAAMYWLYFGLHLFWSSWWAPDFRRVPRLLSDSTITTTMLLVVFGVGCLWLGTKSGLGRRMAPKRLPNFSWKGSNVAYVQAVAIAGLFIGTDPNLPAIGGEGLRQVVLILQGTVSAVAMLMLVRRWFDGQAGRYEKLALWAILAGRVLVGFSSGWLGSAVGPGILCALVYLHKRHRVPITAIICVVPCILFFQVAKNRFRQAFWYGDAQAGVVQKVQFWFDASFVTWQHALEDQDPRSVSYLLSFSISRTSLLAQAANVIDQTPSVVPYQYGALYSYLLVTLVPRFLWPDKPSMNDANQFYQVAYGITREQDLGKVSVAVGMLTEGYINFSWYGVGLVMFLVGVLLDFWNETFLARPGAPLAAALGIALIPQLTAVEFQLAQYLSGIVQHVLLTMIVFLPITRYLGGAFRSYARNIQLETPSLRP